MQVRSSKAFGEPQPGYMKLATGWAFFFLLLAVVCTPALLFSSGNPSIVANPVLAAHVNLTLRGAGGNVFPVYNGGMQSWIGEARWDQDLSRELGLSSNQVPPRGILRAPFDLRRDMEG